MLKIIGSVTGYEVRRKSDRRLLYVLSSGEGVFCYSVATVFPSFLAAKEFILGLGYGLKTCEITRVM